MGRGSSSIMDCKLCFKTFSNGKALGAHMRSHYAILPLPPKHISDDRESTTGNKSEKSSCLPDPARFKRPREIDLDVAAEMEERDVALCLIMLSRDAWGKKIHRCEECHKVFKSSQGLGSHKATHFKKVRNPNSFLVGDQDQDQDQVHECALCPRIFKSAQALGGHKRSHLPPPEFVGNLVDLNLPAAVNDEILA